jgi:signal transduction histidine kinase
MKNELKRINRIVEGFLRLTKPGGYHFKKEDINSIIQYNVSILEQELIRHGIKIHLNFNSALPAVKVDRDRLNQVFSNLILNAIEAMPRGGDITITTEPDGEKVRIQVSDNGFGIPQEDIRKVFNPYFSTKEHGFGLGLTLIQDIIHNHKGRIAVQSEKGKGTDFTILLPVDFSNE